MKNDSSRLPDAGNSSSGPPATGAEETALPETPIRRILYPFERFLRIEASSGILLIVAAAAALIWANVPGGEESYGSFWHTPIGVSLGPHQLSMSVSHWINDSLMGVFFFVVGLEIKREMLVGELSTARKAALPIVAALGGMVVPALIFVAFNGNGPAAEGWGIPMATDIAFALGLMALLGKRVPLSLKVFITALAIVDDLGALLVIAIFYTSSINFIALAIALATLLVMFGLSALGVRTPGVFLAFGIIMWLALLDSGMHATLAGVLSALAIPARRRINGMQFTGHVHSNLAKFEREGDVSRSIVPNESQQNVLDSIESAVEAAQSPMARLERALHPWVMYAIMPLFALANAGVTLAAHAGGAPVAGAHVAGVESAGAGFSLLAVLGQPVSLGVLLGLFIGKPVGIALACWIAVRTRVASLPDRVRAGHIVGAGSLAGIGFTMSLFISDLALPEGPLLVGAKIGFLAASLLSGIAGSLILLSVGRQKTVPAGAAKI